MAFHAQILTLLPDSWPGILNSSLSGQALAQGRWSYHVQYLRNYATDKHHTVDDKPLGGGPGMVLRPDVAGAALDEARNLQPNLPLLCPVAWGTPLKQERIRHIAQGPGAIILCSRFEGLDQRLFETYPLEPVSIGDYILSGADLAAQVILDACLRLLPGAMNSTKSIEDESFESGLLEYPHYTRPQRWQDLSAPDILLSGNHGKIANWRKEQSIERTRRFRPDLLD